jgi:hypothetical protein
VSSQTSKDDRDATAGAAIDPARYDPWSGNRLAGMRWIAASSVIHAVLLVLFATVSLTVIRKAELIPIKIVEPEVGTEELDGANSLEDLAGLLEVAPAPRRQAQRPRGPVVRNLRAPQMPKIGGIGPKLGRGPQVDVSAAPLALGSGGIGGLGGNFGDYVGGLRKLGLDLVLVIDTTESMQFVIDEVKDRLAALVAAIQRMVPTSRVGIVVYRDQGDEYVVKWSDLSFRTDKLQSFLSNITASGGGDWEEAVLDGLDAAVNELTWRKKSKKIIVLVGGSPPHPEDVEATKAVVREFRASGGHLSAIDVTDHLHIEFNKALWRSLYPDKPFEAPERPDFYRQVSEVYTVLAKEGGGELVQLAEEKKLIRDVIVLTFGSRWKIEMAKFMKELS